jgi:hypothetical protein
VLISTFKEFDKWLSNAAIAPSNKTSFWDRLFGVKPSRSAFNRKACSDLRDKISLQIKELTDQLHSNDDAEIVSTIEVGSAENIGVTTAMKTKGIVDASAQAEVLVSTQGKKLLSEQYKREKVEFLRRHILDYQSIFDDMADVSAGASYLFLDDLYHIARAEQPKVLDYFHSVAKGHQLWLKVGTIRHRSDWYIHGNPPIGMKIGDDAEEIDLDLTLEKYDLTKKFLLSVLDNFLREVGMKSDEILTDDAKHRLILASGGVARDFLSILRRSIEIARERCGGPRGPRIGTEDVNIAAGEYDTSKRAEFKRDVYDNEENKLNEVFGRVRQFCLEVAGSNCFLIDKDASGDFVEAIHELVDLKLLHLIRSRVTLKESAAGRVFEAYMLDLSQYAGSRKRRGLEMIEFWRPGANEKLRRAKLIPQEGKAVIKI